MAFRANVARGKRANQRARETGWLPLSRPLARQEEQLAGLEHRLELCAEVRPYLWAKLAAVTVPPRPMQHRKPSSYNPAIPKTLPGSRLIAQ